MTTRFARTGRRAARNPTGHGPAHLNKFAFRHNPNSAKTRAIAKIPHRRVCARCYDILEWRKAFRKYKASKHPRRCDECGNHAIINSYHVICEPCSEKLACCAKCKVKFDANNPLKESASLTDHSPEEIERALAGFKERNRRSMLRAIENGVFTLDEVLKMCDPVGNIRFGYSKNEHRTVDSGRHPLDDNDAPRDSDEGNEGNNEDSVRNEDSSEDHHSDAEDFSDDAASCNRSESELGVDAISLSLVDR